MKTTLWLLLGGLIALPCPVAAAPDVAAILDLAELHMRHRTFDSAFDYYQKAVANDDLSIHAHIGLQEAARRAGKDVYTQYEARWQKDKKSSVGAFLYARLLNPGLEVRDEIIIRSSNGVFEPKA